MSLLKKAVNETAAAKLGIYGEAGSGKTRTSMEIAIGLAKLTGRPIAFFDTEGGSDFFVRRCEEEGIDFLVAKARAFKKLMGFVGEASELGAIAIVDSISHTWDDLRQSYEKQLKRTRGLEIWDWGIIKPQWQEFTTAYLTSPIHFIVCGRAASVYEQVYNEQKGKSEVQVVGSRMKTEKETGYEPSLLIEMERAPQRRLVDEGVHVIATVVKDRSDTMDGQMFDDPTYETFLPFFGAINIGGEHHPTDASETSVGMFATPDNAIERKRRVEIALDKIKEAFVLADCAGTSKDDKKKQTLTLIEAFDTSSWTAIQNMRLEDLEAGLTVVRQLLGLDATPLSEDEIDALSTLVDDATKAGHLSADESAEAFAWILSGDWGNLRALRDRIEAMKPEPTSGESEEQDERSGPSSNGKAEKETAGAA